MKWKSLNKVFSWRLIGPVLVIVALMWAGPGKVWAALSQANLYLVAAAILLGLPLIAIKGIRWKAVLAVQGIELSVRESTAMYARAAVLAAVTPGRIGDFTKIVSLVRRGNSLGRSITSNILDRIMDVGAILLAGYAGMWHFSMHFAVGLRVANIAATVLLVVLVVLAASRKLFPKIVIRLVPSQYRSEARRSWGEIVGGFQSVRARHWVAILLWTLAFWALYFCSVYLCSLALGLEVSFVYLCACLSAATLLSLLPITVAGAGTRDASFVFFLGQIGVTSGQSLALSALVLGVFLGNMATFYALSVILGQRRVDRPEDASGRGV